MARSLILEASIAIALALVTSFWLGGERAFVVGVMALVLLETLRFRQDLARSEAALNRVQAFIAGVVGDSPFSELRLVYGLRVGSRLGPHAVHVPRDEVLGFWRDCLARTKAHWFVAAYTRADETWDLGWGESSSLAIQRERLDSKCKITRVFIVDSESERDALLPTMRRQRDAGVKVRWVLKDDLAKDHTIRHAINVLETLEVAVADGEWVYRTYFDPGRCLTGASASDDRDVLAQAEFFVREAYDRGHLLS